MSDHLTNTHDDLSRLEELLNRLVMSGPKASHVSASECHEITDDGLTAIAELRRYRTRAGLTEGQMVLLNDARGSIVSMFDQHPHAREELLDILSTLGALLTKGPIP
jgi:hypothetical protein